MTKKIKKPIQAMWVDESISQQAMYILQSIPLHHDLFLVDFQKIIAVYRTYKTFIESQPMHS